MNSEQSQLWNGTAGQAWVEMQDFTDRMFRPFEDLLVDAARACSARAVLDVGCGAGGTTLAMARAIAPHGGRCLGVDISQPLVAAASERARTEGAAATFVCDDAQTHDFEPASFDLVTSRFGVMFFDDFVQAFSNLRRATRAGGALRTIVWRTAAENGFMTAAERAAAPLLPDLPARSTDGPGQFALADQARVRNILDASGWRGVELQRLDTECTFPAADLPRFLARLGPVGRLLGDKDETTRRRVLDALRPAFDPFVHGDAVRYTAACWMVCASA